MGAISGITSPSNGSAEFNGTSDYIETGLTDAEFPSSAFTFSAWANTDTNTDFKTILGADTGISSSYGSFYFQISNIGYWRLNLTNSAGSQFIAQDSVQAQTNKWYYVTGVFDGSSVKIYKDGSLIASTAFTGTLAPLNTNTLIGAGYFQNNIVDFWDGNLANVAIWNRALTSDEINSVMWKQYEEISTSERNGLQAWYSLDSVDSFDWYTYAQNQGAVIEGRTCVDNALNALAQL